MFRLLPEINESLIKNTLNSNSEFISKDDLVEEFTINANIIEDDEQKESQFQSVNATASIPNVTVNEDIPSFREWTKKQLEEAEKQPGMTHLFFVLNQRREKMFFSIIF